MERFLVAALFGRPWRECNLKCWYDGSGDDRLTLISGEHDLGKFMMMTRGGTERRESEIDTSTEWKQP